MYNITIIGAGRSGRGMLGELFNAQGGYHITFVDNNSALVEGLRKQGFYHVTMSDIKSGEERISRVEGFDIIDAWKQQQAYLESVARADIVCTALLPGAFDDVMDYLAKAIRLRREMGIKAPMHITLGANYVGLPEYFSEGMSRRLSGEDAEYYAKHVRLIMSIVNRKNLLPTADSRLDDYHIIGDNKAVLRVEDVESLRNLEACPQFFRFEKNLSAAMAVKIWGGNLVQCSMAFVALKYGLNNTYDAAYHPISSKYAYYAALEGGYGVAKEYGIEDGGQKTAKSKVAVFRSETFRDSLYRIAREPVRKLGKRDRFIGPALLCLKYGKTPYFIAKCCAYGFFYRNSDDSQSLAMGEDIKDRGIERVIEDYCGLDLRVDDERLLYELILSAYRDIADGDPVA